MVDSFEECSSNTRADSQINERNEGKIRRLESQRAWSTWIKI